MRRLAHQRVIGYGRTVISRGQGLCMNTKICVMILMILIPRNVTVMCDIYMT